jgi:hypothetical protein
VFNRVVVAQGAVSLSCFRAIVCTFDRDLLCLLWFLLLLVAAAIAPWYSSTLHCRATANFFCHTLFVFYFSEVPPEDECKPLYVQPGQ